MPSQKSRATEMKANLWHEAELSNKRKFQRFCSLIRKSAPPGKWLDVGCGTGTLIAVAMESGIEIEGVEPISDRRELARMLTGATIHDRRIELLGLPSASFAAVTLTDVFSHLLSPAATLSCVHNILQPSGILLLHTSEIGAGVMKHHHYSWNLGDIPIRLVLKLSTEKERGHLICFTHVIIS
jgi:2-polyprenyl-3-methyl-5-hydroxy-6-metoxy-1,4-benzoquinol methylase